MADVNVEMNLTGRPAIFTPGLDRPKLGLVKGQPVRVSVLGVYQVAIDEDVDAYFVVILPNGMCAYAGVDQVQFLNTEVVK